MNPMRTHFSSAICGAALLVVAAAADVEARQAAQSPPAKPASGADAQAPVVPFPTGGITLDQAVQLTLEHDPQLRLKRTDELFARGVAQQLRGAFDLTLRANAEYTHRTQELSEGAKTEQITKREKLQAIAEESQLFLDEVSFLRGIIGNLRNAPPGGLPLDDISRINPSFAATLATIEQLILTSPPDQRPGLLEIRRTFLEDSFNQLTADLNAAAAQAQTDVDTFRNLGSAPTDEVLIDASAQLRFDKQFRSGILLSPFMEGTFQGTNYKGKRRAEEFGGKGAVDQLQFRAGVDFTVPLLRNRGVLGTAAQERAAQLQAEAATLAIEHQSASSVLKTVNAYWALRAAQDAAAIAAQSAKFQADLVALTQQMITAGTMPGVEGARAQAAAARAQAQLQDAERQLVSARVTLADAMGVAVSADPASLPLAAEPFPDFSGQAAAMVQLLEQAIGARTDVSAAAKTAEAGDILVAGARRNLASRFDVSLGTWYTALGEGSGGQTLDRWVGPSGSIALDYEKPFGNNTQEGLLLQAEADAAQRRIARLDLERRVRLAVVETAGSLQQAVIAVQQARAARDFYQATIESEMRRLSAGDSTLIDVVLTQQQQIDTLLTLIQAEQQLAQRLARLRFETGGLVTGGKFVPRDQPAGARNRK